MPLWFLEAYDLTELKIERLKNGLTVMILEDHAQPLVSTQMLYKVGARNECVGATGLAHFVEHMAFRATKNFPGTQVVSRIYAVGGEWHGYTWIDETTYFETVPVKYLDLVLQIQADRMQNTVIHAEEVEAERGAVITELHSYENDPATVLNTATVATSFLQHPYRYDTIGWLSDVQKISHQDLVNFYRRFYNPSNAVLAVAGDVDPSTVLQTVHKYFDPIPAGDSGTLPRTVEPPQNGERRVVLNGPEAFHYFQIAYRALSANDKDFPVFLLLQAVLGGSSGVNFRQKQDAEEAHAGTRLHGVTRKLGTYLIPTADPYVFIISGQAESSARTIDVEEAIEKRISELRDKTISNEELESARKQVLSELIFDIETTEDAAHQMAYFEGIGAFRVLQKLPQLLRSVTTQDVQTAAKKYLQPHQRTIGWHLSTGNVSSSFLRKSSYSRAAKKETGSPSVPMHCNRGLYKEGVEQFAARKTPQPPSNSPLIQGGRIATSPSSEGEEDYRIMSYSALVPQVKRLSNGIVLIVRRMARSPAGFFRALVSSNNVETSGEFTTDAPVWGYTSIHRKFLLEELEATVREAGKLLTSGLQPLKEDPAALQDPEYRLNQTIEELLGAGSNRGPAVPVIVSVVGDVDESRALSVLENAFGSWKPVRRSTTTRLRIRQKEQTVRIPGKAQSQVGYAVLVPVPSDSRAYAYRALLYIMTHGYEGRLGMEMIAKKGLIYYISSNYNSDGKQSWISIRFGVDPDKLDTARSEFEKLMGDLRKNPPTEEELAEAKEHLIGRRLTAYQSNEELSGFYVREWIEQGRLLDSSGFERHVRSVTLQQLQKAVPQFLNGVTAIVDTR